MKELSTMTKTGSTRKTKAALAACAVVSTVAATAAYRRRGTRQQGGISHRPSPAEQHFAAAPTGSGPQGGLGDTQPL
jgi:hypothetical protein